MLKKNDSFFDFIFINRLKFFHYFIIKKLTLSSSPFKSFLFIKEINVNELIQFVKSFILIFINTNNSENELTSHTF